MAEGNSGFVIANLAGFFAGEVAAIEVGMGTRRALWMGGRPRISAL